MTKAGRLTLIAHLTDTGGGDTVSFSLHIRSFHPALTQRAEASGLA